jgi:hypothetical protein
MPRLFCLLVSLTLGALVLGGCAESSTSRARENPIRARIVRTRHPILCPLRIPGWSAPNSFDMRILLGMSEQNAASLASARGCTLRVVSIDGHTLPEIADLVSNRVDAVVNHGIVTGVHVG